MAILNLVVYSLLTRVALFTEPPDCAIAPVGHILGRQAAVPERMPFSEHGFFVVRHTIVVQGCAQKSSPLFAAVSAGDSRGSRIFRGTSLPLM